MNSGLPVIQTVILALRGRLSLLVALLDEAGVARSVDSSLKIKATFRDDPDGTPFLTKESAAGEIILTAEDGVILIDFADEAERADNFSSQRLAYLTVELLQEDDDTGVSADSFLVIPANQAFVLTYPMSAFLSIKFINTLDLDGETGGAGYLDGLVTLGQAVGCVVQFKTDDNPPEQWRLDAGTEANVAGSVVRGLDYSNANQKYWRRIV